VVLGVKLSPKNPPRWGLTPLITWAVIDPVMRAVIIETQGSSTVETRASGSVSWHYSVAGERASRFAVIVPRVLPL